MTFNKLSSLTRTAPVLSLLAVAAILFAASLAIGPQTAATTTTTTLTPEEEDVEETQETAIENLTEEDRDVNGIEFTPRWGAISTVEPDSIDVLFADCLEDEFAVSSQFVFETSDIIASQSFAVAFEDDDDETAMTWIAVVENTHGTDDKAASIGVMCASENDDDDDDDDSKLDARTKITIDNTVKQFIKIENNEIVNIDQIIKIRNVIIQDARQIVDITGNNNTVTQIISQSAPLIVSQNATEPEEISQIINQTAQQEAAVVIPEEEPTEQEETITPPANQTITIEEPTEQEETITPPANQTITIEEPTEQEETITPPADQTITPPANQTITIEEPTEQEETITPPADQTIEEEEEGFTTTEQEETITPPANQTITPPANQTITPPANQTITIEDLTDGNGIDGNLAGLGAEGLDE
jgi:hypothetical protein